MNTDFAPSLALRISTLVPCCELHDMDTPFALIQVAEKNIAFHLVDLATYQLLAAQRNCEYFFRELSEKYLQKEIQIIHVWEDVWRRQPLQVEARVAALLGHFTRYHARSTTVKKIANPVLIDFLRQHHLQAPIGGRYKYGLFLGKELLAVASFSAVRPMLRSGVEYRSHELLRFANRTGCIVAGGLSKLLAHFVGEQNPDDIMSYVDCDWGSGKGYKMLGFERVGELPPQAFLLDTKTNVRHYMHQKTGEENFTTIYNSGSYKYIKDIKNEV